MFSLLPRDAMHSADYAVVRCPSVCLSHARILSKRLHMSSNFFCLLGSHTILVFPYQTGWQYYVGDPLLTGAWRRMQAGYKKNNNFQPIYRIISDIMQDRAIAIMKREGE